MYKQIQNANCDYYKNQTFNLQEKIDYKKTHLSHKKYLLENRIKNNIKLKKYA